MRYLNLAPRGVILLRSIVLSHYARHSTSYRGATLLASLTSKLVDLALLRYLRPEFCSRREGIKILLLRQKEKYGMSKKTYRIFGGEERI